MPYIIRDRDRRWHYAGDGQWSSEEKDARLYATRAHADVAVTSLEKRVDETPSPLEISWTNRFTGAQSADVTDRRRRFMVRVVRLGLVTELRDSADAISIIRKAWSLTRIVNENDVVEENPISAAVAQAMLDDATAELPVHCGEFEFWVETSK